MTAIVCDPKAKVRSKIIGIIRCDGLEFLPPNGLIDPLEGSMLCPTCGYNYNQIIRVSTRLGSDENEACVYPGTEALGCTGHRRSALVISFEGECEHEWNLVIQQHKGQNFVSVEYDPNAKVEQE
jgi:hypothetical protein